MLLLVPLRGRSAFRAFLCHCVGAARFALSSDWRFSCTPAEGAPTIPVCCPLKSAMAVPIYYLIDFPCIMRFIARCDARKKADATRCNVACNGQGVAGQAQAAAGKGPAAAQTGRLGLRLHSISLQTLEEFGGSHPPHQAKQW